MVRLRLKISKECLTINHCHNLVSVVTGWRLNESPTSLTHGLVGTAHCVRRTLDWCSWWCHTSQNSATTDA